MARNQPSNHLATQTDRLRAPGEGIAGGEELPRRTIEKFIATRVGGGGAIGGASGGRVSDLRVA